MAHNGTEADDRAVVDRRLVRDLRVALAALAALFAVTATGAGLSRHGWWGWLLLAVGYGGSVTVAALGQRWLTTLMSIRDGARLVVIERVVDLEEGVGEGLTEPAVQRGGQGVASPRWDSTSALHEPTAGAPTNGSTPSRPPSWT